jgi:hypothetical protein
MAIIVAKITSLLVMDIIFPLAFSILYHSLEDVLSVIHRKDPTVLLDDHSIAHFGWQSFKSWLISRLFISLESIFQQLFVAAEDICIQKRHIYKSNNVTIFFIFVLLKCKSCSYFNYDICKWNYC